MPRTKKNPITGLPAMTESEPTQQSEPTKSNVVPISTNSESVDSSRDWGEIDSVLSNVVNFI